MASGVPASDKRGSSFFVLQSHGEGVSRDDGRRTARVARRRRRLYVGGNAERPKPPPCFLPQSPARRQWARGAKMRPPRYT